VRTEGSTWISNWNWTSRKSFTYPVHYRSAQFRHTHSSVVSHCCKLLIWKQIVVLKLIGLTKIGPKNHLVQRPLTGLLYQPRMIDEYGAFWWNENWQGTPNYWDKICPSATLSTKTNSTWPDLGSNPGRRDGKPATNRLSCGTPWGLADGMLGCNVRFQYFGAFLK
jgi:hypothetical protein